MQDEHDKWKHRNLIQHKLGNEEKFNYLIAIICILILRDNAKHVLTKY